MKSHSQERMAWAVERQALVHCIEALAAGIKTATDFISKQSCPRCDQPAETPIRCVYRPLTGERREYEVCVQSPTIHDCPEPIRLRTLSTDAPDDGSTDHCGCCAHRRSTGCGGPNCPCFSRDEKESSHG